VVAVLSFLQLPVREGIILACMCLVSHGFLIETAVMKRTGSQVWRMVVLRLAGSLVVAFILNLLMPGSHSENLRVAMQQHQAFGIIVDHWFASTAVTVLKILILVNALLIVQQILTDFGWIRIIEKPLKPLMRVFGLPVSASLSWLVANLIGLAYGSAVMIEESEKGRLNRQDADLLNHHIALSHSQLEDPLLFLTLGYTLHWLIWPRILIAFAAVWLRRLSSR
jgi:hypothetical protein